MKIWPIITLGALLYGSTFSDGMGVPRGSPPVRHHASEFDPDDFIAPNQPHRVASMTFRSFFAQMLQDQTEWTAPQGKQAAVTGDTDADDGEDPGKKLFWTTTHPGSGDPAPFPGWGYPDPDRSPVAQPACGECRPTVPDVTYYTIDDPAPPHEDENAATTANSHTTFGNLPFGGLQSLSNLIVSPGGEVIAMTPCATALVDGVCLVPCTTMTASLPSCDDKKDPGDGDITTPLGGLPTGPSNPTGDPITAGGGSGSGVGGGVGGGVSVGGVPEPSTWMLMGIGFALMSYLGRRRWSGRKATSSTA